MARVPYLDREDLPPEDRDIYDGLVAKRGFVANLFRVLANAPGLLRRLLAYSDYVRHDLGLDPHLRELAILTVGRVCRVDYEFSHHWQIARGIGLSQEKLEALGAWERTAVFTAPEAGSPCARFAAGDGTHVSSTCAASATPRPGLGLT